MIKFFLSYQLKSLVQAVVYDGIRVGGFESESCLCFTSHVKVGNSTFWSPLLRGSLGSYVRGTFRILVKFLTSPIPISLSFY